MRAAGALRMQISTYCTVSGEVASGSRTSTTAMRRLSTLPLIVHFYLADSLVSIALATHLWLFVSLNIETPPIRVSLNIEIDTFYLSLVQSPV